MTAPLVVRSQSMARAEPCSLARYDAAFFSDARPDEDRENEDALALLVRGELAAAIVADGAGGLPCAADAARCAVEAMRDAVDAAAIGVSLREAILDGFEQANARILALGAGAACTLAVAELGDGWMRPYHAGDAQVLVTGQRGRLKHITTSHSPVGYAVEAGVLDEGEALHHADLHLVSNLLGSSDLRIEVGPVIALAPRDTVVVGSDGLFDNLHVGEIVEVARRGGLVSATDRLAAAARERMAGAREGEPSKPDDLSFVVVRRARRGAPAAATPSGSDPS